MIHFSNFMNNWSIIELIYPRRCFQAINSVNKTFKNKYYIKNHFKCRNETILCIIRNLVVIKLQLQCGCCTSMLWWRERRRFFWVSLCSYLHLRSWDLDHDWLNGWRDNVSLLVLELLRRSWRRCLGRRKSSMLCWACGTHCFINSNSGQWVRYYYWMKTWMRRWLDRWRGLNEHHPNQPPGEWDAFPVINPGSSVIGRNF